MKSKEILKHTDLKKLVIEAIQVFERSAGSTDAFTPFAEDVVSKFFDFNAVRVSKFYKKTFKKDLPMLSLTKRIIPMMGLYDKDLKKLYVVSRSFQKLLFALIAKGLSPKVITDSINARMLFTMLHEVGHYHYYTNNMALTRPFITVAAQLKGITGIKKVELILENKDAETFILNEANNVVKAEKYADNFAFLHIQKEFRVDFNRVHSMRIKSIREDSYITYAKKRVILLVERVLDFLPKKDQALLSQNYFKLLENN